MNSVSEQPAAVASPASETSAVEKAIRARALRAIEQEASRPPVSMQRRVLIIALVLVAAAGFLISVNFVVTGMHRIMDIWYPGSITNRTAPAPGSVSGPAPPPGTAGSDKPFAISVVPASGNESASSEQSSSK